MVLRLLVVAVIICMIRYSEFTMAMEENPCSEFSYATFANVATYLDLTSRQQLNDYGDPEIMGAILAYNYNISQEQIEIVQHGLHDYDDPKIRAIILANDYQISQQKIDVIKHAVKSAIIRYDHNGNFVILDDDNKVVNAHTKVQRYTKRKRLGSRSLVTCDVNKMPTVSEDDVEEECSMHELPEFAFSAELHPDWYSCQDDGTL